MTHERDDNTALGDARSELRAWFGWTWLIAVMSVVLATAAGYVLSETLHHSGDRSLWLGVVPPLVLLGLLAYAGISGRRQMALGMLAAMGSMFALMLLLIAACFGMFASKGF